MLTTESESMRYRVFKYFFQNNSSNKEINGLVGQVINRFYGEIIISAI